MGSAEEMGATRIEIGRAGEAVAVDHLRLAGYEILTTNYRCQYGEVDVIAMKEGVIAFVEVRTRCHKPMVSPEESVDRKKQMRVRTAARHFLCSIGRDCSIRACSSVRFDVIAVTVRPDGSVRVQWYEGAF